MISFRSINDWVAIKGTTLFGTVWLVYIFFFYGFIPLIKPDWEPHLLYWSNTVQLWALPLILTGTNLLGRVTERILRETHDVVLSEFKVVKEEMARLRVMDKKLDQILKRY